ncbi:hypothetical protein BSG8_42790 [Bacillus subtilis subsp. natto]|uniref:hypothetical protein n=1 Tax=Bacillus subtilis TaxID=1423 RepID=UPI0024911840|nr:hypothetical protein [Bacillus subtilis]BDB95527.1 hypothetical protein BSG8_42790 [Bacillus subtilis subsp. natto]
MNNVEAMTTFKAREEALFWPQSANINELTNEIYVASQENEGTELRIEIRDLDTGREFESLLERYIHKKTTGEKCLLSFFMQTK